MRNPGATFILPEQPPVTDARPRNAFGMLKGFGAAMKEYYDRLDGCTHVFQHRVDERGRIYAQVMRTSDDVAVMAWSVEEYDAAGGQFPPIADGYMKNLDDMSGLCHLLDIESCKGALS